jgi:hypothetical protein
MKLGREINITIPEPTILLNQWQRMHWTKRKKYHEDLYWKIRIALKEEGYSPAVPLETPMAMCKIEIDRYSDGKADWDGMLGGLKPLFDTLVVKSTKNPLGLGIIEDDNPDCILQCPVLRQHKSTRKAASTVVTITEILEA